MAAEWRKYLTKLKVYLPEICGNIMWSWDDHKSFNELLLSKRIFERDQRSTEFKFQNTRLYVEIVKTLTY